MRPKVLFISVRYMPVRMANKNERTPAIYRDYPIIRHIGSHVKPDRMQR